jgi:acetyl esterase/lipase
MREKIATLLAAREAAASQPAPTLAESRTAFDSRGGYQLGSFRSHGELAARLGRASGRRVLLPEYRLAPEHPFPAAVDDVLAVWRWLRGVAGLAAGAVAVAGDSAGGGLALVGSAELLLSDSEELAKSASAAGVDVTVALCEGAPHVYPAMLGTPEAAEATDQAGAFLRDKTGRAG